MGTLIVAFEQFEVYILDGLYFYVVGQNQSESTTKTYFHTGVYICLEIDIVNIDIDR